MTCMICLSPLRSCKLLSGGTKDRSSYVTTFCCCTSQANNSMGFARILPKVVSNSDPHHYNHLSCRIAVLMKWMICLIPLHYLFTYEKVVKGISFMSSILAKCTTIHIVVVKDQTTHPARGQLHRHRKPLLASCWLEQAPVDICVLQSALIMYKWDIDK